MVKWAALAAAALVGLTGCVSAADGPTGSAAGAIDRPTGPQHEACVLFEAADLRRVLGQQFEQPINTADSTQVLAECQWTASSQTALVMTKVSEGDGPFLFRESATAASRSLGKVELVTVPKADKAYSVRSLGRVGMLVGDSYVEVSTLVPGAGDAEIMKLARMAATAVS